MIFFGCLFLLMFICGLWATISPRSAYLLGRRWQYDLVEPSRAALIMTRVIGIVSLVMVGGAGVLVLCAVFLSK
jgi:hypothetical protein